MSDEEQSYKTSPDSVRAVMVRQVGLTVTTTDTMPTVRTTTTIVSPASTIYQTPSIAVTGSTGSTSAITTTKRGTGKRAAKIEFVRFDSVETIFKQNDHDDIVCAKIKDEIKRYVFN